MNDDGLTGSGAHRADSFASKDLLLRGAAFRGDAADDEAAAAEVVSGGVILKKVSIVLPCLTCFLVFAAGCIGRGERHMSRSPPNFRTSGTHL